MYHILWDFVNKLIKITKKMEITITKIHSAFMSYFVEVLFCAFRESNLEYDENFCWLCGFQATLSPDGDDGGNVQRFN